MLLSCLMWYMYRSSSFMNPKHDSFCSFRGLMYVRGGGGGDGEEVAGGTYVRGVVGGGRVLITTKEGYQKSSIYIKKHSVSFNCIILLW